MFGCVCYGYVPDTLSGDGEALDAYILGVDRPVDAFAGRVIAVIYREDDTEEGRCFTRAEIAAAVAFMERYSHTSLALFTQEEQR